MEDSGADMTNTFRCLSKIDITNKDSLSTVLEYILTQVLSVSEWAHKSKPELSSAELNNMAQLAHQNSLMFQYITGKTKQWLLQQLQKSRDYEDMLKTMPEDKLHKDRSLWSDWLITYLERLLRQTEGLSPSEIAHAQASRIVLMNKNNPKFILRNYLAENAIADAEKGNYEEVNRLLKLLKDPYGEGEEFLHQGYDNKPPESSLSICVTCSS